MANPPELPPCGLYRTTVPLNGVPENRLVYFHNHGTPGPGVYVPVGWNQNVARFQEQGTTVMEPELLRTLAPLPAQGMYRVLTPFHCCEKKCRLFETETLVQLGYDGAGQAILFVPELSTEGLAIPTRGQGVTDSVFTQLSPLKVAAPAPRANSPRDITLVH